MTEQSQAAREPFAERLPPGWRWVRLGDLSSADDAFADGPFGSNLKTEHYVASGARVVRLQNIGIGRFLSADEAFISLDHFDKLSRHHTRPGDVVVAALGDGARPAGRACVLPDGLGPSLVKADCFRVRLPRGVIVSEYLVAFLNSPEALARAAERMRGATRPRLNLGMLRDTLVPLAPLPEQRRVVDLLRDQLAAVERGRAAAEARLEAARTLTQAYLRGSFPGATVNAPPPGWRWTRLGEVADVVNGFAFPEHLQGRQGLRYPFFKVSDMNAPGAGQWLSQAAHTVDASILSGLGARAYPRGTVVFPKVGGALLTNKKRLLAVEATFDNNVMGLVPKTVDAEWLYFYMLTVDLPALSNVQALPSIKQSTVSAIRVPWAPPPEQQRVLATLRTQLTSVEALQAATKPELAAINALPAALLRRAFSGEL